MIVRVYRETKKHKKARMDGRKKRCAIKHNTTFCEFGTFIINPIYLSREWLRYIFDGRWACLYHFSPPELFVYFVCKLLLTLVENNNDNNITKNIKKVYMYIIHGPLSAHIIGRLLNIYYIIIHHIILHISPNGWLNEKRIPKRKRKLLLLHKAQPHVLLYGVRVAGVIII